MGKIHAPQRVKLFSGILTSLPEIMPEVEKRLSSAFGVIDLQSDPYPFDMTHYYDEEMGGPITRHFFSFVALVMPAELSSIKKMTNELEEGFAKECGNVRRPVNLDPGYLEESKIVLASTKNFYHRILLADGIYGEVTLRYAGGSWQAFPWSFPDFSSGRYDGFFTRMRQMYRNQIKEESFSRGQPGD